MLHGYHLPCRPVIGGVGLYCPLPSFHEFACIDTSCVCTCRYNEHLQRLALLEFDRNRKSMSVIVRSSSAPATGRATRSSTAGASSLLVKVRAKAEWTAPFCGVCMHLLCFFAACPSLLCRK